MSNTTLIIGVTAIAGFLWVKAATTFTGGMARATVVLLALAAMVGLWWR